MKKNTTRNKWRRKSKASNRGHPS